MPFNDRMLDIGGTAMKAAATHASIHTATPNASGSNASAAPRVAIGWGSVATGGDWGLSGPLNFTGGAANGAAVAVGLWDAPTGGNFLGYFALTGDQTFNAAGEYSVTSLPITGTAA